MLLLSTALLLAVTAGALWLVAHVSFELDLPPDGTFVPVHPKPTKAPKFPKVAAPPAAGVTIVNNTDEDAGDTSGLTLVKAVPTRGKTRTAVATDDPAAYNFTDDLHRSLLGGNPLGVARRATASGLATVVLFESVLPWLDKLFGPAAPHRRLVEPSDLTGCIIGVARHELNLNTLELRLEREESTPSELVSLLLPLLLVANHVTPSQLQLKRLDKLKVRVKKAKRRQRVAHAVSARPVTPPALPPSYPASDAFVSDWSMMPPADPPADEPKADSGEFEMGGES